MLLLAADFYYLKNIAGRRLVGLRWWNEVDTATGDSHWVFESQDRSGNDDGVVQNATDKRYVESLGHSGDWTGQCMRSCHVKTENDCMMGRLWAGAFISAHLLTRVNHRFFWLALYIQPALWVGLAIIAIVRLRSPIWLSLIGQLPPSIFAE